MAETSQNKNDKKKSSTINWYVGVLLIFILVVVAGFSVNIHLMNKQFRKNEEPISKSKQINNPLRTLNTDSTKIYKLTEEDLQKINDHIDYLSDKVEGEVKRTQENNQYDIDRINTLMTIGIGLLAIIGGLLPLVVNFFSKEHLEKRMNDFEKDSKHIIVAANDAKDKADKAKEDAELAKSEAGKANKSVEEIEDKIKKLGKDLEPMKGEVESVKEATKKIPYIDLLVFQNAVAKLTSTDALKLFIGASRYTNVAAFLQNLVSAIDSFGDDLFENNPNFDVEYFKNIVTELQLALRLGPIRRIPDGRSFQNKIEEAVLQLDKFEKMETKNFKTQLKIVSEIITELKKLVDGKIV
jgi:hypothetical protein